MGVVGIDLAGSPKRDTGYCFLEGRLAKAAILHSDNEILASLRQVKPSVIAIDAPLSLPKGRRSIDARDKNHFRQCDLALRKLGIRFFPITLGPMRMLTKRGMSLKRKILKILPKARVIEVYPGAAYDLLGCGRKDRPAILRLFRSFGIKARPKTQDGLDGVMCAIVAKMALERKATALGKGDGRILIPIIKKLR
jgi:predicted nuclease with RNAse H fold